MDPQTRDAAHAAILPLFDHIESGRYIAKTKALMGILGVPVTAFAVRCKRSMKLALQCYVNL
jgi:hypothetical protein